MRGFRSGTDHGTSTARATNRYYRVNPSATTPACEYEDFALRGKPCKHILAVRMLLERQMNGEPDPTREELPARPPRPTY